MIDIRKRVYFLIPAAVAALAGARGGRGRAAIQPPAGVRTAPGGEKGARAVSAGKLSRPVPRTCQGI